MEQIHKRFTTDQVKALLRGYCQGKLDRSAIEDILEIGKTQMFGHDAWEMSDNLWCISFPVMSPGAYAAEINQLGSTFRWH